MSFPLARLTAAALVFHSVPASAGRIEIDLPGAIARARRVAPASIAARGRVVETEAAARGAAVPFVANPELEAGAGPRLTPGHPIDGEVRIAQELELGHRGPRRRVAAAEVDRERAVADDAVRGLDREVALAYCEAVYAARAEELARRAGDLAQRAADAAERRRRAGDITDLDASLAATALGRARSAALAAGADRIVAVGRIAALIGAGADDTIVLTGALEDVASAAASAASVPTRADIRVLDGERAVAAAEHARAVAGGRPELGLWAAYQREDTASVVVGGLRLTLPVWNRNRGEQAAARARGERAAELREATVRSAAREVADAMAAYAQARESLRTFEREVVPRLDDSERLLQRTIDAGQIAVGDYLLARQQILEGRREHLDRGLALATAAIAVRYATGGAP